MAKPSAERKEHEIVVRVSLPDDKRAREASLVAYAFSQGGKLLDAKPLQAKGEAAVRVPLGAEGTNVRLVVGPQLEGEARSLTELARRRAPERHVRVDLNAKRLTVDIALSLDQILCWLRSLCAVNGTVIKRATLDGQNIDLPVCDATVEVYEVDPLYIILPKLPKSVLDRLRDIILHPIPLPDPIPDPLPGPFPGPFPPEPGPGPDPFFARAGSAIPRRFAAAATGQLPISPQRLMSAEVVRPFAAERPQAAAALAQVASASALQFAARTASDLEFRRVLLDHQQLIRPIFCLFYPHFFSLQLVATTKTDDCGHFHTLFFRGCNNPDTPDLYFKVKQRFLNLFDITIYAPTPVPCYTWWNYTCGAEVTLVTHHPLARTCPPCPPVVAADNWVLFVAIGQKSLNAIYGNSDALQGSTTPTNRGLTKEGAPFGGNLRPQILFDNALRESLGVKYYRLSWRRVGDPGWIQMLEDVGRHYTYDAGGGNVVSALYNLGPLSPPDAPAANLYEIPPSLPPQGVWGPVIIPTDYQNGVFNTALPAPGITYDADGNEVGLDKSGKFEIQLELFNTAGNPVNIAALGIKYVVPDVDDLTGTITTVDAATLGLVTGNAMIVTAHVDNNPTFAEIDAPSIGAASADPCCGILGFDPDDSVTLPWRAKHKNGFATFTFQTKRVDQLVFSTPTFPPGTPVGLVGNHSTTQNAQTFDGHQPAARVPARRMQRGRLRLIRVRRGAGDRRLDTAQQLRQLGLRGVHAQQDDLTRRSGPHRERAISHPPTRSPGHGAGCHGFRSSSEPGAPRLANTRTRCSARSTTPRSPSPRLGARASCDHFCTWYRARNAWAIVRRVARSHGARGRPANPAYVRSGKRKADGAPIFPQFVKQVTVRPDHQRQSSFWSARQPMPRLVLAKEVSMITSVTNRPDETPKSSALSLSRRDVLVTSISIATSTMLPGGISPALAGKSATPIYAIRQNGDMLFYEHMGADDGSPDWPIQAQQIGNGWDFRQVFAGDNGAVYAIRQNGDMLFYQHAGFNDGSPDWPIQAQQIGNGWDFRQVFAGDNGAVYAIRQNGDMLFYKHAGFNDGSPDWPIQAEQIGNGWDFRQVFAGDNGAVYAIRENGDMLFYKHAGFNDGSPDWPIQAEQIGNGWDFRQVFAGPEGAVYAIGDNGDMLFYKHAGFNDGSPDWPIQAERIGNGWDFRQVFAGR